MKKSDNSLVVQDDQFKNSFGLNAEKEIIEELIAYICKETIFEKIVECNNKIADFNAKLAEEEK